MGNFNDTPQKEHQTVFLEQILKSNSSKKYIPLPYTPLLGVTLTCGYRIVKFINYHYWRKRQQYLTQSKQNLLRLIFQRKFSDTSYSRIKYKSYYTNKLDRLLDSFFKNKDLDLFECPEVFNHLSDLKYLQRNIRAYYTRKTMKNHINFYQEFITFIKHKRELFYQENPHLLNTKKKLKYPLKKFHSAFMTNSNNNNNSISNKHALEYLDDQKDEEQRLFEDQIDNLFQICVYEPIEKIPKHLTSYPHDKNCFLLLSYMHDSLFGEDMYLKGALRKFVKKFFYNYTLKRFGFIAKTDGFYIVDLFYLNYILKNTKYEYKPKGTGLKHVSSVNINNNNNNNGSNNSISHHSSKLSDITIEQVEFTEIPRINTTTHHVKAPSSSFEHGIEPDCEFPALFMDVDDTPNPKSIKYLYNGEYDTTNFLFSGFGTLLDLNENSCYEGVFRYGKKNCIGIKWQENEATREYVYYSGEWFNDIKQGYGNLIVININERKEQRKTAETVIEVVVSLKMGHFNKNKFISGNIYSYTSITKISEKKVKYDDNDEDEENQSSAKPKKKLNADVNEGEIVFVFWSYGGDVDFDSGKFMGFSTYNKKEFSFNSQKGKLELENEIEYKGDFVNGLEEGFGYLRKYNRREGYTFEYEGGFVNGMMNGYGSISYSDNFFIKRYEGFFENNKKFYLYGIVEFRSGDIYEGFFDEKYMKDYIGLYQHYSMSNYYNNNNANANAVHGDTHSQHNNNAHYYHKDDDAVSVSNNELKLPSFKFDNYFGFFSKDKKHGLGRFVSVLNYKTFIGAYVNGEKQGQFQLTSEEDMLKEAINDLFSYDLNNNEIEYNIINLATRIKASVVSQSNFRKKNKKKKKLYDDKKPQIVQRKMFFFFENNDVLDKSERPFDF